MNGVVSHYLVAITKFLAFMVFIFFCFLDNFVILQPTALTQNVLLSFSKENLVSSTEKGTGITWNINKSIFIKSASSKDENVNMHYI